MTSQPSAISAETPAAAPVDPTVAAEVSSSEAPVADKGDGKPKRTRVSIGALRADITAGKWLLEISQGDTNRLRTQLNETRSALYTTEDNLAEVNEKLTTAETALVSARTALELALAILAEDRSATDIVAFLPKKAKEFGIDFGAISKEALDALGKAYAKAPERAVNAVVAEDIAKGEAQLKELLAKLPTGGRRGEVRTVSGSGINGLMEALLGLGGGGFDEHELGDPRDTETHFFHGPTCPGHRRSR